MKEIIKEWSLIGLFIVTFVVIVGICIAPIYYAVEYSLYYLFYMIGSLLISTFVLGGAFILGEAIKEW